MLTACLPGLFKSAAAALSRRSDNALLQACGVLVTVLGAGCLIGCFLFLRAFLTIVKAKD